MEIKFAKIGEVKKGALVVQVLGGKLGKEAAALDKKAGGALAYALKNTPTFKVPPPGASGLLPARF